MAAEEWMKSFMQEVPVHNSCMWDPCVWLFLYVKEVVPIYFVVILISLFYFPPLSHCICMHSFHGKLN